MKTKKQNSAGLEYSDKEVKNEQGLFAWTAKVGSKGQIVIPKEARDRFNIKSGDTVLLLGDESQESYYEVVKNNYDNFHRFRYIFDGLYI